MDSTKSFQQQSEETITFTVKRSTRSRFIAKLFLILGLTSFSSYFTVQSSIQEYKKGQELTEERYLADYNEYKTELLNAKNSTNPVSSIFVMFIAISFMIGSYELMALMIGLIIEKLIR